MLSALQHYLFCPRQCALIHVEGAWAENYLTSSGRVMHDKVDQGGSETRGDIHKASSLRLISNRIGLMGVADQVEFHRIDSSYDEKGNRIAVSLPGRNGIWQPIPIEYKHGKPKGHRADEVQLCGQAICMEEMFDIVIPFGYLFYGETRRRVEVTFDAELRTLTENTVVDVRKLMTIGKTPPPNFTKGCAACSLVEICQPEMLSNMRNVSAWIDDQIGSVLNEGDVT